MKSLPLSISANKVAVKVRAAVNARMDTGGLWDRQVIACVCLLFAADAEGNEGSEGWMWAVQCGRGAVGFGALLKGREVGKGQRKLWDAAAVGWALGKSSPRDGVSRAPECFVKSLGM